MTDRSTAWVVEACIGTGRLQRMVDDLVDAARRAQPPEGHAPSVDESEALDSLDEAIDALRHLILVVRADAGEG